MKRLLVLILCAVGLSPVFAQVPKLINYQGAVRNDAGFPLKNRVISVKFDLRTGSPSGVSVWQATESLSTNLLGLFTTQIGKVNATAFQQVDWSQSPMFLSVSIDTTNGSSHTEMGVQELVSVPYALRALTVPVSYTANILTIGQQSFDLTQQFSYDAGEGISIVSGSVINTAPDKTIAINPGNHINVTGTYPDYTVSAVPPTLLLNGSLLSIEGSTVTLPSPPVTSVVSTGAATTATLSSNSYSIHVAPPTFVNSGPVTITGNHPNFTITSVAATNASLVSTGMAQTFTLGTNSYSVHVAPPVITQSTNVSVLSNGANFTISSNPSLGVNGTSIGISGGNSVTIPPPVLTQSTNVSVLSNGANFTISSNPSLGVNGTSIGISGGNSVTIPPPVITQSTNVTVNTSGANFTISSRPTLSISSGSISISGGNSVTLPPPVLTQSTNVSVLANGSNFTISSNPSLGVNGNSIGISGGNSVTIPPPVLTQSTNISVLANGSNFTISSNPSLGVNGNSIGISGGNSVTIPPPVISQGTNVTVNTVGSNFTISSTPLLSIASGSISISGGNSVALPVAPTVTASGLASVSGGPNYTVSVPTLTYVNSNGFLVSGTNSVVIRPALALTGSTLSVGQTTNTIDLSTTGPWRQSSGSVTLATSTDKIGIGTNSPTEELQVETGSNSAISILGGTTNNSSLLFGTNANHSLGALVYDNSVNKLDFRTNSTSRMTILGNGNVGIGPVSPDAVLNVEGSADLGTGNAVTTQTSFAIGVNNNVSGIVSGAFGTSNTVTANRAFSFGNWTNASTLGSMLLGDWGSGGPSILTPNAIDQFSARFDGGYRFFTDGVLTPTNGVYFGNTGKVGIANNAPAYKLSILGNSGSFGDGPNLSFATTDDAYPTMHFLNWNHSEQWMMFNAYYDGVFRSSSIESNFAITAQNYSYDALQFKFASGNSQGNGITWDDAMVIRHNGFVGIGLSGPSYLFHVQKDDPGTLAYFDNNSLSGGTCLLAQVTTNATSTGSRFGIQSNAWYGQNSNYGIYSYGYGGTNSYGVLGLAGGSSSTNYGVYCSGSGGYTGSWTNVSDRKFKENIRPLTGALDKIMQLSPKVYTLKRAEYSYMNFPEGDQLGLIAQEVEMVLPELVENGANPGPIDPETKKPIGQTENYKSMNYIGLTPVLVQAIKEQQAQIEELRLQLQEQKKLIEELRNK